MYLAPNSYFQYETIMSPAPTASDYSVLEKLEIFLTSCRKDFSGTVSHLFAGTRKTWSQKDLLHTTSDQHVTSHYNIGSRKRLQRTALRWKAPWPFSTMPIDTKDQRLRLITDIKGTKQTVKHYWSFLLAHDAHKKWPSLFRHHIFLV